MKKWLDVIFESSTGLTEEFAKFNKEVKSYIKKQVKKDFDVASWNRGHFYFSAFLKHKTSGKFVYISSSDVRFFRNAWYNILLIRTAKHDKDYTGGSNCYCELDEILNKANKII